MKTIILSVFLILMIMNKEHALGQSNRPLAPEVNKQMPNFTLTDIDYFPKNQASLEDFKGKWLFLDFWFKSCTACINAFPKMNTLQEKFKDKLNIVLVGQNGDSLFLGRNLKTFYENIRKEKKYNLTSSYDSVLALKWNIRAMPHIIIVDPNGKVYAKTNGANLTEERVRRLINGEKIQFSYIQEDKMEFEGGPGLDSARINPNLISRSILLRKTANQLSLRQTPIDYQFDPKLKKFFKDGERGYKAEGVPLFALYNIAYFGRQIWKYNDPDTLYKKTYLYPILEMHDKSMFDYVEYKYNYALTVPSFQQSPEKFKKILQQDLERAFGYQASIEKRMVPVWVLTRTKGATDDLTKLKNDSLGDVEGTKYRFIKRPFKEFLSVMAHRLPTGNYFSWTDKKYVMPLVNETAIPDTTIINIRLNSSFAEFEKINKELMKYGLKLTKESREYWTLVIKDPDTFSSNSSKNIK